MAATPYQLDYQRQRRKRLPDQVREEKNAWRRQRVQKLNKIKLDAGCSDCGYNTHPAALEFDHVSDKKAAIGQIRFLAWDRVMAEIAKCEVVCANCHRVRTEARRAS